MEHVCLELASKAPIADTTMPLPPPLGTGLPDRTHALFAEAHPYTAPDSEPRAALQLPLQGIPSGRRDPAPGSPSSCCEYALSGGAAPP